jgi:phage recombination protein Bet
MTETTLITLPAMIAKRNIDEAIYSALKNSIFPGASDESIALAHDYCAARKLDIMKKPCHIVGMSVKDAKTGKYEWRDVIMPGIGELRITAQRTGEYAGQDAPVFGPMIEVEIGKKKVLAPEWCTMTVYRIIGGQRVAFHHTEFFDEACGTTKDGDLNSMWTKRRRGQLAKCAEAGALRKAFPEESGGIITAEEVEGDEMRDVTPPKSAVQRTNIEGPTRGNAPPQEQAPPAQQETAPPPTDTPSAKEPSRAAAPTAAFVKSVDQSGDEWLIVLKGAEREMAVVAENSEIGQRAKKLVDCPAWVVVKARAGKFVLTSIKLKEEGGDLL